MAAVVTSKRRRIGSVSSGAIRRIVRSELKQEVEYKRFPFYSGVLNPIAATPLFQYVSTIPQGVDPTQRLGIQVKLSKIIVRGKIEFNPTGVTPGAPTAQSIRLMLIMDSQGNGYGTAATDRTWLVPPNNVVDPQPTTVGQLLAQRALTNTSRDVVLRDKIYTVDTARSLAVNFKWVIRSAASVHFLGTGSTTAEAGRNSLIMCIFSTSTANGPQLVYTGRIVYTDM